MGRRTIREFRAAEALALIGADREGRALPCPSCGIEGIERNPPRRAGHAPSDIGRITLTCSGCGRTASYIERAVLFTPEAPREQAAPAVVARTARGGTATVPRRRRRNPA